MNIKGCVSNSHGLKSIKNFFPRSNFFMLLNILKQMVLLN